MVCGHLPSILTTAQVILMTKMHSPLVVDVVTASTRLRPQMVMTVTLRVTLVRMSPNLRNVKHHVAACHRRQQR